MFHFAENACRYMYQVLVQNTYMKHVIQSISVQRQAMTLETIVMYSLKFSQQYFILDKIFNNIELFTRENNIL